MNAVKVLNNRYQLLAVIKRGGFGTIYKGYDSVLGKDIAVKEINPDLVEDKWYIEQFQKEARHVAKMNHQNIVHIFDLVETEEGHFYIVMEFIDGVDLNYLLKENRLNGQVLPEHLSVHIIAEVCKALDYAHNCRDSESNDPLNLVHQDISPSNIMISKAGIVKLIDFGIAGVQKEAVGNTEAISLQGKIQYMSPEHVSAGGLNKSSDLFSLGLVLYELLEGTRFFHEDDTHRIVETLRNGKLKLKNFTQASKPLQKIIAKAIEKSPEKRFQNANQFYIDLVTYLVTSHDSSSLDSELSEFVQKSTNTKDRLEVFNDALDIQESDLLFDLSSEQSDDEQADTNGLAETEIDLDNGLGSSENLPAILNLEPTEKTSFEPAETKAKPADYFEMGDEIKTIIDVVRLSTRGHKKLVIKSALSIAILTFVFFLTDIIFQWTSVGADVYDFLFPPAITVTSVPEGAQVFLNEEPVPGKTPLEIAQIEPGVYELKLALEPYKPITKSLHIPSKGQIEVKGEDIRSGNKPYVFRFKTTLEIESVPDGATVFINGIKYGQNTPCSVTWEIGDRCEIRLEKAGFTDLTGFALNERMDEEIEDRRLWDLEISSESDLRYRVQGLFGKFITIDSNPPQAAVFLDSGTNQVGLTGAASPVFLTATKHKIMFSKQGYNSRTLNITVDENTPTKLFATLTRPVSFAAFDAIAGNKKDLNATLKVLSRGRTISSGRKTPYKLNLGPQDYSVIFSKAGYEEKRLEVSSKSRTVTARMSPSAGQFSVVVLDNASRRPLSNVEVRYNPMDKGGQIQESVDITDLDGTVNGVLAPGLYTFRMSKNGFQYKEKTVVIEPGDINLIEFDLKRK